MNRMRQSPSFQQGTTVAVITIGVGVGLGVGVGVAVGVRCRTLTHFRCKGNMVDRVPQIEEDASPGVGKSAMLVFAADRATAGVTVNVPA